MSKQKTYTVQIKLNAVISVNNIKASSLEDAITYARENRDELWGFDKDVGYEDGYDKIIGVYENDEWCEEVE